ncbi:MAG TPA: hypothetical protein PLF13_06050 [candidate division Zixibacteria bacterium]|nr:hypothetical protein [candidate division Zixibacteria bacterium]
MKKLLLALLLFAIIIGISYIKARRGNAMVGSSTSNHNQTDVVELWAYEHAVDSLKYLINQQDIKHQKDLQRNQMETQHQIDSLIRLLEQSETTHSNTEIESKGPSPEEVLHRQQILDHYRKLYRALPRDLTQYEMRVALYEIRLKTAEEFEISLEELKAIRSEAGLSY